MYLFKPGEIVQPIPMEHRLVRLYLTLMCICLDQVTVTTQYIAFAKMSPSTITICPMFTTGASCF